MIGIDVMLSGNYRACIYVNGNRILLRTHASLKAALDAQRAEMAKQGMQWGAKATETGKKRSAKDAMMDD